MNTIKEIREKQNQIITMINSAFDEIVTNIEKQNLNINPYESIYESAYPITNVTGFKGRKPIAVTIDNSRIITPTWKRVVQSILQEVVKDQEMKNKLFALSDKLLGKVRSRLSKNKDIMHAPIEICDGLYIETHYDTETLMRLLVQVLEELSYDYSNIKIIIKN